MYQIKATIKTKENNIEIIPIGDIHYGNRNCRYSAFEEMVDYIKRTPHAYVIGMGDYLDCILTTDKRYDPNMSMGKSVDEARDKIKDTFAPIKEKILCLITGNHEFKLNTSGFGDPTMRLADELSVPYAGYSCFLRVHTTSTRNKDLMIYAHHGYSTGRLTGSNVNSVEKMSQFFDADIYLVGHSHKLWATRQIKLKWGDFKRDGERKVAFGNTGTFLETYSNKTTGYAERAGYPPTKIGVLKIKYYPKTRDIHISE